MDLLIQVGEIDPGCFSFVLFGCECAVNELYSRVHLGANKRINPDDLRVFWERISVEKAIHFLTMPMQVKDESYLSFLTYFLNKCLYGNDFGAI